MLKPMHRLHETPAPTFVNELSDWGTFLTSRAVSPDFLQVVQFKILWLDRDSS